jgi:hypothetical protein
MERKNHQGLYGRARKPLVIAVAGLLPLLASVATSAAVRAQVDPAAISAQQSFALRIDSDDAQSDAVPDLSPLRKDFDVLGTSASSQTSFINGHRTDSRSWIVQLMPHHAGKATIPPLTVGTERTAGLDITVTEPSPLVAERAARHVFIEVDAPAAGTRHYVQQQFPYTVRLFYDDAVQSGELSAPAAPNAIIEQLGGDKHFTVVRDGHPYHVTERHYAIAPEASGSLRIPPARFQGTMIANDGEQGDMDRGDDLMSRLIQNSPMANDPFFKDAFRGTLHLGGATQAVSAVSRDIAVGVDPRPAGAHGAWLPAQQITLHDSWQEGPPHFKAGEPVTRVITIDAKGLAASQIPQLQLADAANARLYPEPPDNQSRTDGTSISGTSTQRVTYIPTAPGSLTIAPIQLAWWNTVSDTPARAELPGRAFTVAAGATSSGTGAQGVAPAGATAPSAGAVAPLPDHQPQPNASAENWDKHVIWVGAGAAVLAIGVLVAAGAWRWRRRAAEADKRVEPIALQAGPPARADASPRSSLERLQQACAANDSRSAADALIALARSTWPSDPPLGLAALALRVEIGGDEIRALDRCLYGNAAAPWNGSSLANAMRGGLRPARAYAGQVGDGLDALYSHVANASAP